MKNNIKKLLLFGLLGALLVMIPLILMNVDIGKSSEPVVENITGDVIIGGKQDNLVTESDLVSNKTSTNKIIIPNDIENVEEVYVDGDPSRYEIQGDLEVE